LQKADVVAFCKKMSSVIEDDITEHPPDQTDDTVSEISIEELPRDADETIQQPEVENSDDEYILVPEADIKIQDERLQSCQETLIGSRQQFDAWSDKFTRRRMFALSRLRKLQRTRRERFKFYDDLKVCIEDGGRVSSVSMGSNSVFSNRTEVKH